MANVNSLEYEALAGDTRGRVFGGQWNADKSIQVITLTTPAVPAIGDVHFVALLPPSAYILMQEFLIIWPDQPAGALLDFGWPAYLDVAGNTVAGDSAGLLLDLAVGVAAGRWFAGLNEAAADAPVVSTKAFNNRDTLPLILTNKTAAMNAAEVLTGYTTFTIVG